VNRNRFAIMDNLPFDSSDLVTLGVFVGSFVLCGIVVYFVSVVGAKEQVKYPITMKSNGADVTNHSSFASHFSCTDFPEIGFKATHFNS
jgi:hypothetical protein